MAGAELIQGFSSGLSSLTGIATSAVQHHYNKKLASYQNDINIKNWNMQNEYNSPVNQRKRLEEAGINSAAVFGSNNTGNAGQIAQYQQPSVDISQSIMNGAQLAVLSAQARKTNAEAANTEAQNPYAAATAEAILDGYLKGNTLTEAKVKTEMQNLKNMEVSYDEAKTRISQMNTDILYRQEQTKSERSNRRLTEAKEVTEGLQQALISINTENAKKTGEILYNQNILTANQARVVNAEAWIKEWEMQYTYRNGHKPDSPTMNMAIQTAASCLQSAEQGIQKLKQKFKRNK